MSKRNILKLIDSGVVDGWNDPRLLTILGMKRRGYPAQAINEFCDLISITRRGNENIVDISILEECVRRYYDEKAQRIMAVLRPIELVIENVPEDF